MWRAIALSVFVSVLVVTHSAPTSESPSESTLTPEVDGVTPGAGNHTLPDKQNCGRNYGRRYDDRDDDSDALARVIRALLG
ncbi:hypothetical protein AAVH_24042 [Aphelenchoides avenae]|nr:hypothetical protein AAVH_24042 [Aphelenchus avenae]